MCLKLGVNDLINQQRAGLAAGVRTRFSDFANIADYFASECSDAPVPSKSGLPPPPQIPGRSFASANSFFLYALQDADQDEVLAAMVEANIKVVRIFITEIYPNEKATNNSGYPDVEPGNVGVFNSTILEAVDKLMYKAFQHKIKLNIALHDRYALCTWKCDAYARKYNLIKTPDGTNANVVEYYRNPAVNADLDARYAFIVNHQNKYFGNRPWKLIPEAIFAFDMENESQSYNTGVYPTALPLPNPDWACDRATALRAAGVHPRILLSTGGGADVEDSLITNHFACPALDIVPVHSYDVSKWDKGLNSALTLARQYNKLTFVQEYGATSNKAKNFASQIAYFEKYMLPHMIWEILKPNNPSDYEVYKDDTSTWDLL
ncbi:glycoside hydrolase superfamily, partial [Cladochytrium replicatum]